jgi:hypothetical protein
MSNNEDKEFDRGSIYLKVTHSIPLTKGFNAMATMQRVWKIYQ